MMLVIQVRGEPTRWLVQSSSLECVLCGALFSRLQTKWSNLRPGLECPKCRAKASQARAGEAVEVGRLDVRLHLVDLAVAHPVGTCQCEHYQFNLGPKVNKLSPSELKALTQQQARALRCSHIEAARTAAIDIAIRCHEQERGNGSQQEERQP
jgi:hypothetical protein